MTGRRRAAFDPGRLDDLTDVLAPPQPSRETRSDEPDRSQPSAGAEARDAVAAPPELASPAPSPRSASAGPSTGEQTRPSSRGRAPGPARATSGRQARVPGGRIATAVRIPAEVYQDVNDHLLSGIERPSYGQLVMWSVEDHRDAVVAAVEDALPDPSARNPRGRRLAQDRVPIGLQLLASERAELDELAGEIAGGDVAASRGVRVTRTDVATAALRVAVQERTGQLR